MTSSETVSRIGGNRRPQTFRNCRNCTKLFGPLDRLAIQFCSRSCVHAFRKGIPSPRKGKHYPHLRRARVGQCLECGKEYRAVGDWGNRKQKYCSKKCAGIAWKKNVRPRIQLPSAPRGEKNPAWRGDKVSYSGLHYWIKAQLGAPRRCEHCGSTNKRKYEWANKDHEYRRNVNDFMRLCTSCHRRYDIQMFS